MIIIWGQSEKMKLNLNKAQKWFLSKLFVFLKYSLIYCKWTSVNIWSFPQSSHQIDFSALNFWSSFLRKLYFFTDKTEIKQNCFKRVLDQFFLLFITAQEFLFFLLLFCFIQKNFFCNYQYWVIINIQLIHIKLLIRSFTHH